MNYEKAYNNILENHNVSEVYLDDILTTIEFRLNKNTYHLNNIINYIEEDALNNTEYIYYECENLIINVRSTLDNILSLINQTYHMNYKETEINIKNIRQHKNCTNALKDVFVVHTHPKNQFWNFIYTTRNEIVHEICIKTELPIVIDDIYYYGNLVQKVFFINKQGDKEDLLFFMKQCVKLINELVDGCVHVLENGLY